MSVLVVLVALAIAAGLIGVVLPLMPGSIVVAAAILVWAAVTDQAAGWVTFAIAATLIATGSVIKYLVPGKRLASSGIPTSSLIVGGACAVVGLFVVPGIGLPLGFVAGIYAAERQRTSHEAAWPATVAAVKAVGLGIAIELAFSSLAAAVWVTGVIVT